MSLYSDTIPETVFSIGYVATFCKGCSVVQNGIHCFCATLHLVYQLVVLLSW